MKTDIKKYLTYQIILQLAKEFSAPLIISIAWTFYNQGTKSGLDLLQESIVHFFAAAWAFSQWNRVKKQITTEKNLSGVGDDVRALLKKIEEQANQIVGYSTGGDSFCEAEFVAKTGPLQSVLFLRHRGIYPVFDLNIEVIDNNEAMDHHMAGKKYVNSREKHVFPSLFAGDLKAIPIGNILQIDENGFYRIILQYRSRAGDFRQDIVATSVEDKWEFATRVIKNHIKVFQNVSDNFPRNQEGEVDWYKIPLGRKINN